MKRLVLFVVALVFAFCTTVMAAGDMKAPPAASETTPLFGKTAPEKAVPEKAEKVKKHKKHHKHYKEKKEGKEEAPSDAPAK
jgi:hypothetical protein